MSNALIRAAHAHMAKNTPVKKDNLPEFLLEELSDRHIKKIDNMGGTAWHNKQIHDKVFGEGNEQIEIPYSREGEEKITSHNFAQNIMTGGWDTKHHHKFVLDHLHRNGYEVTDYVGGYAKKKDDERGREEKIGKILQKTGGDEATTNIKSKRAMADGEHKMLTVSQAVNNDPIRAAKKDVKLVVSRNKYAVGGMSTGKGWKSCMNLDDGCNRHYVPKDIHHGTLTAYLIRKDDTNLDSPVGRVNIKKFEPSSGNAIWRPEHSVYGAMPRGAHAAIASWAESVYPHKNDEVYSKHPELYNDDGRNLKIYGHPESQKVHSAVSEHVRGMIRAEEENYKDPEQYHYLPDKVHSYLDKLPTQHRNTIAIKSLLDQTDDTEDKWGSDMDDNDYIWHWAKNKHIDYRDLPEKELQEHINTAHNNASDYNRYDSKPLEEAQSVHASLLHEVFRRGSQELKDHVISQRVNNTDPDREQWHEDVMDGYSHMIPYYHHHTTNPHLLAKIYEHVMDKDNEEFPHIDRMNGADANELAYRIGKHGEPGLIHKFMMDTPQSEEDQPDHLKHLFRGLNEHPEGENITHHLISELNLGPGHAVHSGIKPIKTPDDLDNAQHTNYWGYNHRHDGIEDTGNNDMYANIAYHTKFKSVMDALKSRNDTQTPEIQDALKMNKHQDRQ